MSKKKKILNYLIIGLNESNKKIFYKHYKKRFIDYLVTGKKGKNFSRVNNYLTRKTVIFGKKNSKKLLYN